MGQSLRSCSWGGSCSPKDGLWPDVSQCCPGSGCLLGLLTGAGHSTWWLVASELDWRTGLWCNAVGLVLYQACRALASRNARPHTVGCQLPQGNMLVEAGAGTGRATLIKHEATVQGAAQHCRRSGSQGHRDTPGSIPVAMLTLAALPVSSLPRPEPSVPPPFSALTGHCPLTTEPGAPPSRGHPCLATVAGVGF